MPATPFLAVCFPNMKHSYAWHSTSTSNKVWLNIIGTYKLDTKAYSRVTLNKKAKDIVVYKSDSHSGIITSLNGDSSGAKSTVTSKWGEGPLVKHNILYVPSGYGTSSEFYRLK